MYRQRGTKKKVKEDARSQSGDSELEPRTSPGGYTKVSTSLDEKQGTATAPEVRGTWYNPHNPTLFTIEIYERELNVIAPKPVSSDSPPPKRKRNDINSFSRKSRLRVLRKFNQLSTRVLSEPIFITLTTRHGSCSPEEFRSTFQSKFLTGLRKIIPDAVYAWRLEPHADGYPHIHMFTWSWRQEATLKSRYYKDQLRDLWSQCMDDYSPAFRRHGCKIIPIRSHRKAMSYVSKYVAKEQDEANDSLHGRRWAVSTNFPASPITEIHLSRDRAKQLKKIAKRLLRSKGGDNIERAEMLDEFRNWFVWLSLDEMIWILTELGHHPGASALERYKNTGDSEDRSHEIDQLATHYPNRMA